MLSFIRPAIAQLNAYKPHPGSIIGTHPQTLDRLDTNESANDLPEELKQKLGELYIHSLEANRYPDGSHQELKEAIAEYVNESAQISPETALFPTQICLGNGSDELIRSILMATCLGERAAILAANPTFSMYGILAQTLGIPVVNSDRNPQTFETNLEAAQKIVESDTSVPIRVVFMVHPNSPTGNPLTPQEIEWLKQLPPEILVVIDEAYFEFSQHTLVSELGQHPNWVILRTFSKAFRLASHRVGYAVGHPEFIEALEKVRLPYNLPTFSQLAALLVLQNRQPILSSVGSLLEERKYLKEQLNQISQLTVWPSAGNFLYARLNSSSHLTYETLGDRLKTQGTLIRHTGGGLRITIGNPDENKRTYQRLHSLLDSVSVLN
ncbi:MULTISPECIES: histidinol-phosphate transaminase [unclassified Roseofilum]|uniref:histidinol-phosphate transaminase n=1 Tax=unclassified Roseofilum TaxID=2620099 RepID=UPI000E9C802D|nr:MULTISPECIES: histidinol-phosphate transaminase [unclassified Roseofilum]HBQ98040.1 histidinol-phosphate transaminase [Cyanobacteria bacterium UBA11691]MBP0010303.1 histidinol-phosphate transaminase [Roseofilum sp. Belize Diploria]MBP0014370.1 histidinol-phosphate transaminase [Roseofilum sp. SID3]MBP0022840.1 histidinol-phosphate transaminase [Roseofilum sp. SID2]MBP0034280.1 histidinol-phosphate transaminase [Roseofilum sp. Belize BBD 4]